MSDNIDYAELDKAVNEAIKNRSTTTKTATKPVARPAVQRPRGQFMDFVRTQPLPTPKTAAAMHPAVKPVAKAAPRPAVRPIANPAMRPAAHKVTTAPRPVIAPRSAKTAAPVARPVMARPVMAHPSVAAQIQQRQQKAAAPVARPVAKPVAKTTAKPVAKPVAKAAPVKKAEPAKKPVAPNANNYSLGVRSPFLTNTKVEKRPLGTDIPETSTAALRSTKNVYSSKSPSKASTTKKKHMVTEAPKKHSGWLWTLIVLGVIAAGGGLGYLAYILVFAN